MPRPSTSPPSCTMSDAGAGSRYRAARERDDRRSTARASGAFPPCARAGREAEARRHAAAGIEELARWQSAFASLDLQSAVRMHGQPLLMDGLSSAMRSAKPDVLFEWSERARQFNQRIVPLRPPPDPEVAADLAELRVLRRRPRGIGWRHRARPSCTIISARRQWSETSAAGVESPVTMDELQGALDADTALLSFVWSEGRDGLPGGHRGQSAGDRASPRGERPGPCSTGLRSDLDMSASVRAGPLADVVRQSLHDRLRILSDTLLAPAVSAAGTRRFLITAPGVLNGIPWGMLPALNGRPFTIAVSATRWASLREARASAARRPLDSPSAPGSIAAAKRSPAARRRGRRPPSWTASGHGRRGDGARFAGGRAAHRRARKARGREPAVLGSRARRRDAVRLRHRSHPAASAAPSSSRPARSAGRRCGGGRRRSA